MNKIEHFTNLSLENIVQNIEGYGEVMEEWRPIPDWEGLYEVSNFGRVKMLRRELVGKNGQKYVFKERIKKPTANKTSQYLMVTLTHNETDRHDTKTVHRLVGIVFINNPLNLPEVNHKKGKTEISIFDLEWTTHSENEKDAYRTGKKVSKKRSECHFARKVGRYLNGELIEEYETMLDAEKQGYGIASIRQAIVNNWKCGGYSWAYLSEIKWQRRAKIGRRVGAFTNDILVLEFKNMEEARECGYDKSNVYKSIKLDNYKIGGFKWRFLDNKKTA